MRATFYISRGGRWCAAGDVTLEGVKYLAGRLREEARDALHRGLCALPPDVAGTPGPPEVKVRFEDECPACWRPLEGGSCVSRGCVAGEPPAAELAVLMKANPFRKGEPADDYYARLRALWLEGL